MLEVRQVRSDEDVAAAKALVRAFVGFLRERYPEMGREIDNYLVAQDFEGQLADFRAHFNPPTGECLIGLIDGKPEGVIMLKAVDGTACEMNRTYVRPSARGSGLGRALCTALIAEARALGYREMRLSALFRHHEALPLYRSLGFEPCAPFEGGGDAGDERVIFMRRDLADGEPRAAAVDRPPPSIVPYLTVRDARAALAFYADAFGAETLKVLDEPDRGGVFHARARIGQGLVMLYEEKTGSRPGNGAPATLEGSPVALRIELDDPTRVDAVFERAIGLGARPELAPTDRPWGRLAQVRDPEGHYWYLAATADVA